MLPQSTLDSFAFTDVESWDHVDQCLDASRAPELYSIATLIRGQQQQHKAKRQKASHFKPAALVRPNTRQGKAKPTALTAPQTVEELNRLSARS